jgi:hypothetical protein
VALGKPEKGLRATYKEAKQQVKEERTGQIPKEATNEDAYHPGPYRVVPVSHFPNIRAGSDLSNVANHWANKGYTLVSQSSINVGGPTATTYLTFYKEG